MNKSLDCFIPARSGSARIKNKNIQNFGNTTLLRKAISTAKDSGIFKRIIVSTDGEEIANHVKEFDKEILLHKRPPDLAKSDSKTEDAILHWLLEMQKQTKSLSNIICMLQVTNPFVRSSDLINAYKLLIKNSKLNSILYGYKLYPFFWEISKNDIMISNPFYPPNTRPMTQDMKEYFYETGGFYFFKTQLFLESKCRIIPPVGYYPANPNCAIHDINTEEDLSQANDYFEYFKNKKK